MLTKEEIKEKSLEFKLDPADVERDYIQSWILKEIFANDYLSAQLTLKGSGALRKVYCPNTRFAIDIDFSASTHIPKDLLKQHLESIGISIETATGIPFNREVKVKDKVLPEEMHIDALEARMYFKGVYSDYKFDLKTQVDVTQGERLILPFQYKNIIHPYPDSDVFKETKVRVQKLEEIIATKFITLMHRKKPGDLFDLVYTTFLSNNFEINKGQIIRVLLSRTNFSDTFDQTRNYFCTYPVYKNYAQTWDGLLVPVQSSMTFDQAHNTFLTSIGNFFDEIGTYIVKVYKGITGPIFPDEFREKIILSGREKKLVKIKYKDLDRMMEPYKLEYYTRQSDGKTIEYFWAFDRSGGNSQKLSIKQLFCHMIQNVELTEEIFEPQWEVEL